MMLVKRHSDITVITFNDVSLLVV